jgi:DNA-binding transcriptional MerR regulator
VLLRYTLTRRQVAERMGVTVSRVRAFDSKQLHPRARGGQWFYNAEEVDDLISRRTKHRTAARITSGRLTARAFRMFGEGKRNIRDLCIELETTPDQVDKLYEEWITSDLDARRQARLRAEQNARTGDTLAEIRERMKKL